MKTRDITSALKFMRKAMKRYGDPYAVVTDRCHSYRGAMKEIGNTRRQGCGRHLNNRAESSHLPFRRRERVVSRLRRMRSLQKFGSIHSSVYNHFNHQRNVESRARFKSLCDAALIEWRELPAAGNLLVCEKWRLVQIRLTAPRRRSEHWQWCVAYALICLWVRNHLFHLDGGPAPSQLLPVCIHTLTTIASWNLKTAWLRRCSSRLR